MEIQDNLASSKVRLTGLVDLVRGIPIVNRLFGLTIPTPEMRVWTPDAISDDACADPDLYYGQIIGAIFDRRTENRLGWTSCLPHYKRLLVANESLEDVFAVVANFATLGDEALKHELSRSFNFENLNLLSVFDKENFVSIKINHAFWEYLTLMGIRAAGDLPYFRHVHWEDRYLRCSFDDVLIKALRKEQENAATQRFSAGCFSTTDFSFGVSFGNGDYPAFEYLSLPIGPIHKGAVVGCMSFFQTKFPAENYRFTDGTSAKNLIWKQQCDEFFSRIVATSDAVVFIVPTHLRAIRIMQWSGYATNIVVPALHVHELWPAVMPDVAGKLATVFSQFTQVSILVQAGVMSAPLGIMVNLMRSAYPTTRVRYFDMGQVLDIATYPTNPSGTWISQPWIREILTRTKRFPVSVDL